VISGRSSGGRDRCAPRVVDRQAQRLTQPGVPQGSWVQASAFPGDRECLRWTRTGSCREAIAFV
jgi:hypothetical protein